MDNKTTSKRILYLDVARTIAIISITFNHAVNRSFRIYNDQFVEFNNVPIIISIIKTILYCFSRIGVPLFVMISGALLLPRDYEKKGSTGHFLKHNWLQLLITTEIWLVIMFWYRQLSPNSILLTQGIGVCFIRSIMTMLFLNPDTMGSMWYMEMILCVYLLIPILSIALKKIDNKFFLIPIGIVTFCSFVLPDINGLLATIGINKTLEFALTSENVFSMHVVVLILGYWISRGALEKISSKMIIMITICASVVYCGFQLWAYSQRYDFVVGEGYHSAFPLIIAAGIYELLRRKESGLQDADEKKMNVFTSLSRISFGIYFVHICIMQGLDAVIDHFGIGITLIWKFIFLESISFFGSMIIILVLRKIELFKKYLFVIK